MIKEIPEKFFENKRNVLLALVLPAFILYFKSFGFEFSSLDEQWMIVDNTYLKEGGIGFKKTMAEALAQAYYRPVLTGSFFIDHNIGRGSAPVYHFINVCLHLFCVVLLYRFLCLNRVSRQLSLALSILFSVHPVCLHAVAWIPGRNDLLLCLFTLASLINLLKFFTDPAQKKYLALHLLFFIAALFTKENAVMLPLLFLCFYLIYQNTENNRFIYLVSTWAALVLAWFFVRNAMVTIPAELKLNAAFFKNVLPGILLFTGKAILPLKQSVLPTLKVSSIIPGVLTVLMLAALAVKPGLKNKGLAGVGLLMYFALLIIPVWFSAVKNGSEYYEHRMYTSVIGIILFISQLKINEGSLIYRGVLVAVFCTFSIKTWSRLDVYSTKESFVTAGIKESPDFYLFNVQKSEYLYERHSLDSALLYIDKALAMRQDKSAFFGTRGTILFEMGRFKESAESFTKAILVNPVFDPKQYLSRSIARYRDNDLTPAMADLIVLKKCCQATIPPDFEKELMTLWKAEHDSIPSK